MTLDQVLVLTAMSQKASKLTQSVRIMISSPHLVRLYCMDSYNSYSNTAIFNAMCFLFFPHKPLVQTKRDHEQRQISCLHTTSYNNSSFSSCILGEWQDVGTHFHTFQPFIAISCPNMTWLRRTTANNGATAIGSQCVLPGCQIRVPRLAWPWTAGASLTRLSTLTSLCTVPH